jgi:hypothetical protein
MKFNLALTLLFLGFAVKASHGQIPSELSDRTTAQLTNEAFSNKYGRALVVEFGKILRDSANAECLSASKMDSDMSILEEKGREILVKNGIKMSEIHQQAIDTAKFQRKFTAQLGASAVKEFSLLRNDPDVKKLNELRDVARLATVANSVAETVGRHALVKRLGLVRNLSPYSTGQPELMAESELALSTDASDRFVAGRSTPQVLRWEKIANAMANAFQAAFDPHKPFEAGSAYLAETLAEDLPKVCVFPVNQKTSPVAPNPTSR